MQLRTYCDVTLKSDLFKEGKSRTEDALERHGGRGGAHTVFLSFKLHDIAVTS